MKIQGWHLLQLIHMVKGPCIHFMGANSKFKLDERRYKPHKNSEILHVTGMYIEVVEEASKHANYFHLNPGTIAIILWSGSHLKKFLKELIYYF